MDRIEDLVHPNVRDGSLRGDFDPKMTEQQRCEALGLIRLGYTTPVIASLFGVHVKTASQIGRNSANNYKKVRKLYTMMGHQEFIAKYVTRELVFKANATVEELMRGKKLITADGAKVGRPADGTASKRSNQRAGEHTLFHKKVIIEWRDAEDGLSEGWFYVVDGTALGPYPHSKGAYEAASTDLSME